MTTHSDVQGSASDVFRIIVHASPPMDHGVGYWTEAPECPAAHDGGESVTEAIDRTKDRIRTWLGRQADESAESRALEFVVIEAL